MYCLLWIMFSYITQPIWLPYSVISGSYFDVDYSFTWFDTPSRYPFYHLFLSLSTDIPNLSLSFVQFSVCLSLSLSLSLSLHSYWFKSHLAIQLRMYKLKFFCKPCIVQNMKTIIDAFPVLVLSYSSFMFIISGKSYFLNAHPYTHTRTNTNTHIWN